MCEIGGKLQFISYIFGIRFNIRIWDSNPDFNRCSSSLYLQEKERRELSFPFLSFFATELALASSMTARTPLTHLVTTHTHTEHRAPLARAADNAFRKVTFPIRFLWLSVALEI